MNISITSDHQSEQGKRGKESKIQHEGVREWNTVWMSDGIYTLSVTWSLLITFIMWAFSNSVNDSLRWKVSKPDEISQSIVGEWVLLGINSCSQALRCHTGVPLLMEYASLFLEHFEKHHLQFSLLEMNLYSSVFRHQWKQKDSAKSGHYCNWRVDVMTENKHLM